MRRATTPARRRPRRPPRSPRDDLVATRHSITEDGVELSYTVTTGRMVLRPRRHTDDKFDGHQAKAEVFTVAYTADGAGPGAAGHVRVQRRPRLVQRLAAPRACSARAGC